MADSPIEVLLLKHSAVFILFRVCGLLRIICYIRVLRTRVIAFVVIVTLVLSFFVVFWSSNRVLCFGLRMGCCSQRDTFSDLCFVLQCIVCLSHAACRGALFRLSALLVFFTSDPSVFFVAYFAVSCCAMLCYVVLRIGPVCVLCCSLLRFVPLCISLSVLFVAYPCVGGSDHCGRGCCDAEEGGTEG